MIKTTRMEEHFKIRAYGVGELAQFYAPNLTPASARNRLNYWISLQPGLRDDLHASGYSNKVRTFTPAQVRLIVDRLGEP